MLNNRRYYRFFAYRTYTQTTFPHQNSISSHKKQFSLLLWQLKKVLFTLLTLLSLLKFQVLKQAKKIRPAFINIVVRHQRESRHEIAKTGSYTTALFANIVDHQLQIFDIICSQSIILSLTRLFLVQKQQQQVSFKSFGSKRQSTISQTK